MIVSVLIRRLRDGKTYADFRAAWKPDKGFGVPTRVITAQGVDDPREIVTIGFSELEPDELPALLERVGPQEQERRQRLEEIVEPDSIRGFYIQVADDDLTHDPRPETST
jgi:hypothetical protein